MNAQKTVVSMILVALGLCSVCGAQTWQTLYEADFSSDPGWTTNMPGNYMWDPSDSTFYIDQVNIASGGGYASARTSHDGGSFILEYDIKMLSSNYASDVRIGLFDSGHDTQDTGSFAGFSLTTEDRGRTFIMYAHSQDGTAVWGWAGSTQWQAGTWYHVVMAYDEQAATLTVDVTDRNTGSLVAYLSASGAGPFSSDMCYVGSSNVRKAWFQCPGAHSTAKIDNVVLYSKAAMASIEAAANIDPDVLNLGSEGKYITCYIALPEGYNVSEVDPATILLNGQVAAAWSIVDEPQNILQVKFSRADVQDLLQPGQVELAVTGFLTDGTFFEGTDTILVIDPSQP